MQYAQGAQTNDVVGNGGNGYVVIQKHAKPTLKQRTEMQYAQGAQTNDVVGNGGNGYVVIQKHAKATLKQNMEKNFEHSNMMDDSGLYTEFQGPLIETVKQYHEDMPFSLGKPLEYNDGVGGNFVGEGLVSSKQNRGYKHQDWVSTSRVPEGTEDTTITWIGHSDREKKREFQSFTPMLDVTSYSSDYMYPNVAPSCNVDVQEYVQDVDYVFGEEEML
jgi:hypothetical protein